MNRSAFLLSLGLLFGGCAGSGAGLDANGRPISAGGAAGGGGALTADFASIQAQVFTPICSVCHAGGAAPEGLRLDSTNSYALLVGVPSTEAPGIQRVKPSDPNNSYIIQKLQGHAAVGAQMPLGGPPLSAAVIAVIGQWITDGARPAVASAASASFRIAASVPAVGELLNEPPPQITIAFNHEIDATRVDAQSARIERINIPINRVEAVPAQVSISAANPAVLLLTPQASLASGHYRVVMRTGSGLSLSDVGGVVLKADAATESGDWLITEFDLESLP